MKILVVLSGHVPYPNLNGGVEIVEKNIIDCLKSIKEINLFLLGTSDSTGVDYYFSSASKLNFGRRNHRKKWEEILHIDKVENFDRIIINSAIHVGKHTEEIVKKLAKKIIFIDHYPIERSFYWFNELKCCEKIHKYGGKTLSPNPNVNEETFEVLKKVKMDNLPRPYYQSFFEVNMAPDSLPELNTISNEFNFFILGRPKPHKKIHISTKLLKNLNLIKNSRVYSIINKNSPINEKKIIKKLKLYTREHNKVLNLNKNHSLIMRDLAKSKCFLFTSKIESNGIVAFEAACNGVPVITSVKESFRFLKPYGLLINLKNNSQKELKEKIINFKLFNIKVRKEIASKVRRDFSKKKFKNQVLSLLN